MPNGRTTCITITRVQGAELSEFMDTLRVFQEVFGVQTTWLDSEIGASFTGTIKPRRIIEKWLDDVACSSRRGSIAHIAMHQHSIEGVLSVFYKTQVMIATASETNANMLMKLLRAFQEGFGKMHYSFDHKGIHFAVLDNVSDPEAKLGLHSLKALTMLFCYALPNEQGRNPNWESIGYPGALSPPPSESEAPKTISVAETPSLVTLVCAAAGRWVSARAPTARPSALNDFDILVSSSLARVERRADPAGGNCTLELPNLGGIAPLVLKHDQPVLAGTLALHPAVVPGPQIVVQEDHAMLQRDVGCVARVAKRCTKLFCPPTVWISLLRHPDFDRRDLSSLVKGYYGAAAMPVRQPV